MSGYILQPTNSSSGHVINWTALPGVVVGYQDFSGSIVSLASLQPRSGGQQFPPLFPPSAAESLFPLPGIPSPSDHDPMRGHPTHRSPRFQQVVATRRWHGATSSAIKTKLKSSSTDEDDVNTAAEAGERMLGCRSVNYCRICRVTFNAPSQAQQHYSGRHHSRKVRLCSRTGDLKSDEHHSSSSSSSFSASSSNVTSSSAAAASVTSKLKSLQDETNSSTDPSKHPAMITCHTGNGSAIGANVYCRLCSVAFNSDKQALQHYAGKIHAKRLRAEDAIYAYNRNGSRKVTVQQATLSSSAAASARHPPDVFLRCFVCGLQLKSQRLLDRHQRRHRHLPNRVFSGLTLNCPFPLLAGL